MNNDTTLRGRTTWGACPKANADFLDKRYKEDFIAQQQKRAIVDALRDSGLDPSKESPVHVLDIGCGTGEIAIALYDQGYQVTGIDVSPKMLEHCMKNIDNRSINIIQGDLFEWQSDDMTFDAATARWVFAFYPDFRLPLSAVAKMVRKGGVIIFESCAKEAAANIANLFDIDVDQLTSKVFLSSLPLETEAEISDFCDANGMRLEQRRPSTFWHQNPLLLSAFEDSKIYKDELDFHAAKPDVQEFITWFESRITSNISSRVTGSVINVVRKL